MGGNSDEDGSLIQKHWIGKPIFYFLLSLKVSAQYLWYKYFVSILILTSFILSDFGKQIQWTFKRGPPLKYFYGAFESDVNREAKLSPKKKSISHNKAISRPKPSIATKVTTSTKKNSDKNETETTEQFVEQIFHIIEKEYRNNKKQPICYYGLVTNPNSFSATVKSMFYLSFLVKGTLQMLIIFIKFVFTPIYYPDETLLYWYIISICKFKIVGLHYGLMKMTHHMYGRLEHMKIIDVLMRKAVRIIWIIKLVKW